MTVQTYDFGNGPVAAYRHSNGGGWIADTAKVADTTFVGLNARVFDNAIVYGNTHVSGNARVYGNATVYDNAFVYGDAIVDGNARVYGNAFVNSRLIVANRSDGYTFAITNCKDGQARIMAGCRYFTKEEAIDHWTKTRGGTDLGDESLQLVHHLFIMFGIKNRS